MSALTLILVLPDASAFIVFAEERRQISQLTSPGSPRYVDPNVLFTVYRPEVIAPGRLYTLLAFAHLSHKRAGAPGRPEPLSAPQMT